MCFTLFVINLYLIFIHFYVPVSRNGIGTLIYINTEQETPLAIWGAGRSSKVERSLAHGAMGRRIDPSWGGPIELFLVPASAPRLV